jgi:hypothetical protein
MRWRNDFEAGEPGIGASWGIACRTAASEEWRPVHVEKWLSRETR